MRPDSAHVPGPKASCAEEHTTVNIHLSHFTWPRLCQPRRPRWVTSGQRCPHPAPWLIRSDSLPGTFKLTHLPEALSSLCRLLPLSPIPAGTCRGQEVLAAGNHTGLQTLQGVLPATCHVTNPSLQDQLTCRLLYPTHPPPSRRQHRAGVTIGHSLQRNSGKRLGDPDFCGVSGRAFLGDL